MEPALPEQSKNVRINGTTQIRGSMETSEAPSFQQNIVSVPAPSASLRRRRSSIQHADQVFSSISESHCSYSWRMHVPKGGAMRFMQWLVTGHSSNNSTEPPAGVLKEKALQLVRTLSLLRYYQATYGLPSGGRTREQEFVMEELCKRLFNSGVPMWVLQPVLSICSTGLTGLTPGFEFFLLPTSGIIIPPQEAQGYSTRFFSMRCGRTMYRLNMYEKVLARLASFSTNTRTITSVPDETLSKLISQDLHIFDVQIDESNLRDTRDKEAIAKEILDLASRGYGLFFLTRVQEIMAQQEGDADQNEEDENIDGRASREASVFSYHSFWKVDESIRELFRRLACIEAAECLDAIDRSPPLDDVWPRRYVIAARALSSAGSSALWFAGSWQDMLFAGALASVVAFLIETSSLSFWKNQRVIFEIVAGYVVGLTAGLITIKLPSATCFSAIALASMIDYLRGFGIVFSVMEVMAKDAMSGSADLIEAVTFSFLISMSILFGLGSSEGIWGVNQSDPKEYMNCGEPIDSIWFVLVLPVASIGWAASFRPTYRDMPLMVFHGILSFLVSFGIEQATDNSFFASFVAALTVSTVAGLVSRFTGRQALGDTFAGLFALVPGIYIIESFFQGALRGDFKDTGSVLLNLVLKAVIIGVGSWCGTLLCAPNILGTNTGILSSSEAKNNDGLGAVLYI